MGKCLCHCIEAATGNYAYTEFYSNSGARSYLECDVPKYCTAWFNETNFLFYEGSLEAKAPGRILDTCQAKNCREIGDKKCNDNLNTPECGYDGGDCCAMTNLDLLPTSQYQIFNYDSSKCKDPAAQPDGADKETWKGVRGPCPDLTFLNSYGEDAWTHCARSVIEITSNSASSPSTRKLQGAPSAAAAAADTADAAAPPRRQLQSHGGYGAHVWSPQGAMSSVTCAKADGTPEPCGELPALINHYGLFTGFPPEFKATEQIRVYDNATSYGCDIDAFGEHEVKCPTYEANKVYGGYHKNGESFYEDWEFEATAGQYLDVVVNNGGTLRSTLEIIAPDTSGKVDDPNAKAPPPAVSACDDAQRRARGD